MDEGLLERFQVAVQTQPQQSSLLHPVPIPLNTYFFKATLYTEINKAEFEEKIKQTLIDSFNASTGPLRHASLITFSAIPRQSQIAEVIENYKLVGLISGAWIQEIDTRDILGDKIDVIPIPWHAERRSNLANQLVQDFFSQTQTGRENSILFGKSQRFDFIGNSASWYMQMYGPGPLPLPMNAPGDPRPSSPPPPPPNTGDPRCASGPLPRDAPDDSRPPPPPPPNTGDPSRASTWFFTARLQIDSADAADDCIDPNVFTNIIDKNSGYRNIHMPAVKILSFSFIPNRAHIRDQNCLEVTGFLAGNGKTIRFNAVKDWLIDPGLEVTWEAIHGRRDKHPTIAAFLNESALDSEFNALEGHSRIYKKLRIDLLHPSAAHVNKGGG